MTVLHFEQKKKRVWAARATGYEFRVRHEPSGGRFPFRASVCRCTYQGHHHQLVRNELLFARFLSLGGAEAWLEGQARMVISARREEARP
jgi:hypothetical protein